jgi:hypothetical protein
MTELASGELCAEVNGKVIVEWSNKQTTMIQCGTCVKPRVRSNTLMGSGKRKIITSVI